MIRAALLLAIFGAAHAGEFHGECTTPVVGGAIEAGGFELTTCNIAGAKPGMRLDIAPRNDPGGDVAYTACIWPTGDVIVMEMAIRSTVATPTVFDVRVVDTAKDRRRVVTSVCTPIRMPDIK